MVKSFLLLSIGASLFANSDYVPLSKFSKDQQVENNFIRVEKKKIEKIELKDNIEEVKQINEIKIGKPISQNIVKEEKTEIKNKDILKEYKQDNILKDEVSFANNTFSKDFSITPRLSYMYVTTKAENEELDKTHELVPEIAVSYNNHTLKADYLSVNIKEDSSKFDTTWYRLAYLYKYYNVNIGLAYNNFKLKVSEPGISGKDSEKFPTFEVHLKNEQDQLVLEYGGFYGKNSDEIKSAYEYYLNVGYKLFNNDNLIFNLGYKNRTVDYDGDKLSYEGPIVGISTTF